MSTSKTKPIKAPRGFAKHPENINKAGRPRSGLTMADLIRARMEGETGEKIVDGMILRSLEGNDTATKILLDRGWGQAPQSIDMNVNNGSAVFGEWVLMNTRDYFATLHPDQVDEYMEWMKEREAA